MNNASESIWATNQYVIPMADVSHIENDLRADYLGSITVIFKHSRWNDATQCFEPNVHLLKDEASRFLKDWCYYRHELELDSLKTLPEEPPTAAAELIKAAQSKGKEIDNLLEEALFRNRIEVEPK